MEEKEKQQDNAKDCRGEVSKAGGGGQYGCPFITAGSGSYQLAEEGSPQRRGNPKWVQRQLERLASPVCSPNAWAMWQFPAALNPQLAHGPGFSGPSIYPQRRENRCSRQDWTQTPLPALSGRAQSHSIQESSPWGGAGGQIRHLQTVKEEAARPDSGQNT